MGALGRGTSMPEYIVYIGLAGLDLHASIYRGAQWHTRCVTNSALDAPEKSGNAYVGNCIVARQIGAPSSHAPPPHSAVHQLYKADFTVTISRVFLQTEVTPQRIAYILTLKMARVCISIFGSNKHFT